MDDIVEIVQDRENLTGFNCIFRKREEANVMTIIEGINIVIRDNTAGLTAYQIYEKIYRINNINVMLNYIILLKRYN